METGECHRFHWRPRRLFCSVAQDKKKKAGRPWQTRSDRVSGVVLAKREFEAWFLASAESLRGLRTLSADLAVPPDPESVQGAKEWIGAHMSAAGGYREPVEQPALTTQLDLEKARAAPSFDKCYRELTRLLAE